MISVKELSPKTMEFTSFRKKEAVSDDELIKAVLKFELSFLSHQEGLIFHCLLRNFNQEYANLLFVEDMENLKKLEKAAAHDQYAKAFFNLIELKTISMNFHQIQKKGFKIPTHFSCVECGTFSLKKGNSLKTYSRYLKALKKDT